MPRRTRIPVHDYRVKISDNIIGLKADDSPKERNYLVSGVIDARDKWNWQWDSIGIEVRMRRGAKKIHYTPEHLRLIAIEALEKAIFDELDQPEEQDYNPELLD